MGQNHRRSRPLAMILLALGASSEPGSAPDDVARLRDGLGGGDPVAIEREARSLVERIAHGPRADTLDHASALDLFVDVQLRLLRGARPESREAAERALSIRERRLGPDDPGLAESRLRLARVLGAADRERATALVARARATIEALSRPADPRLAEALALEGYLHLLDHASDVAEHSLDASLAIRESALGPDHPDVAESVTLLSYLSQARGDLAAAEMLRRRALGILEAARGPDDPTVGRALHQLAEALIYLGRRSEALSVLERALSILEPVLGPDDPLVLSVLSNLAMVLPCENRCARPRAIYERVIAAAETRDGLDSPSLLAPLMNLGGLLWPLGELDESATQYERALNIAEQAGATGDGLARHLYNLGFVRKLQGRFDESREMHESALRTFETTLGPDHPNVGRALFGLGSLLGDTGDPSGARRAFERALTIAERNPKASASRTAGLRFKLAEVAWSLGDLGGARRDMESALATYEAIPEARHDLRIVLSSYSALLLQIGDRAAARRAMERSVALLAETFGEEAPELAAQRAALARLDGDRELALRFQEQALTLVEAKAGPTHPDVSLRLVDLATTLREAGNPAAARDRLVRASEIAHASFGEAHPETARVRLELARARFSLGDTAALADALAAEESRRTYLRRVLRWLPEREALQHAVSVAPGLDLALSIAARSSAPATVDRAWDALVRSRAVVLDEMASRRRGIAFADDPVLETLVSAWAESAAFLAHVTAGRASTPDEVERAAARRERAERALAEASAPSREAIARATAGRAEVARSLPAESALVAFVLYEDTSPGRTEDDRRAAANVVPRPSYTVFVQAAGAPAPTMLGIGPADSIDALVAAWRDAVTTPPPAAPLARAAAEARYREAGRALRRSVWDPIEPHVRGARRILVVPDGSLLLVNWGTLPEGDRSYLVEGPRTVHLLGTERDLVDAETDRPGRGLLAVGAPDFDAAPASSLAAAIRGSRASCPGFHELRFLPLPAALDEVRELGAQWSRDPAQEEEIRRTGANATEESVKRLARGRRVLHLATHGFLLDDACPSALDRGPPSGRGPGGETIPAVGENPLLGAGLALAGFNRRSEADPDRGDDGVLTAAEMATLDLRGTEWVVLSGCDTGLGRLHEREGIMGLRRAIRIAGARTTVMSLWSVRDDSALEWMTRLYAARRSGATTDEAVRRASVETIAALRRAGRGTHPFFWGAFVASGDWR